MQHLRAGAQGSVLIDGHVHLHGCHAVERALDAARTGLDAARRALRMADAAPDAPDCLWLVEGRGEGALDRLRGIEDGRWRRRERDAVTWELSRDDGARLLVVAGRQIATAEDLEVMVVGTVETAAEGRSLRATIEAWLDRDVLVLLPWGFGKWSGTRRRLVEQAYAEYAGAGLRLADTGMRARWLPPPPMFDRSRADGRPVFVGSDPFPFPDRLASIGSAGFAAPGVSANGWPAMLDGLRALRPPLVRFGRPPGTATFLSLQARMQVRKRLGRR